MPTTTPDNIYYADGSTPMSAEDISAAMATSVQNALTGSATAGYRFVQTIYFTSSGTFTKATYPWLRAIRVRCQGGGGGSGGVAATGAGQWAASSGGTGGAYAESFITNIAGLAASTAVTVGAGGAAGGAGTNGSPGGNSSFGSLVSATGGSQGLAGTGRTPAWPAESRSADTLAAPTTGTGQFIVPGGQAAVTLYASLAGFPIGPAGGESMFGTTGIADGSGAATAGVGYGGGARGAVSVPSVAAKTGAAGAPGIVILDLFR